MAIAEELPVERASYGTTALTPLFDPVTRDVIARMAATALLGHHGDAFLDGVLRIIEAVMEPSLVFIGTVRDHDPDRIQTLVTFSNGERTTNFRYRLAHTPCSRVLGPQSMCIYADGVADLFPLDTDLQAMKAQGYIGMPLLARNGAMIGILAAVTTMPIIDVESSKAVFRLFGLRASLALERMLLDSDADTLAIDTDIASEERVLREALGGL